MPLARYQDLDYRLPLKAQEAGYSGLLTEAFAEKWG